MSFGAHSGSKEDRLSIRTTPVEKLMLAKAAQARHMNVSQFVLNASLREAEQVIREENAILISEREFAWLAEVMDSATDAPRLKEAISKRPIWHVES